MKYGTVIFDLDGTLLDTLGDLTGAVNSVLSGFSFPALDREGVRRRIGDGLAMLMRRCLPEDVDDATLQTAIERFRSYYAVHLLDSTVPYNGIEDTLRGLKAAGIQIAVATNKDEPNAKKLIGHFFPQSFAAVCGMCEGRRRKPATDIPFAALKGGSLSGRVLFVGDSQTDFLTASGSGFDFAGVKWGYGDPSGGVYTAENASGLYDFIVHGT